MEGITYTITITTDEPLLNRTLDEVHASVTRALGDALQDTSVSYDVSVDPSPVMGDVQNETVTGVGTGHDEHAERQARPHAHPE